MDELASADLQLADTRRRAIAQTASLILEHGLTPEDLSGPPKLPPLGKLPATGVRPVKLPVVLYWDAATSSSWSGRGHKPKWLQEAIAQARRLEDFRIVASRFS